MPLKNNTLARLFLVFWLIVGQVSAVQAEVTKDGLNGMSALGLWEADDGDSRWDVTLCGDGTQLCGKLVWIRPGALTAKNRDYLNTWIVHEARRASPNEWRGVINVFGYSFTGNVKLLGADHMRVTGCALLIFCESLEVYRVGDRD